MDKFSKKALHIFLGLSVLVILIDLIMVVLNAHANGVVGQGRGSAGRFASLNGWQVCFIGVLMLAAGILSKIETKK